MEGEWHWTVAGWRLEVIVQVGNWILILDIRYCRLQVAD